MDQPKLSDESHVLLLLASHLGGDPGADASDSGLGPAGWQDFANAISESNLSSPGDLLNDDSEEWPDDIWTSEATREWVANRLDRSTQLAMQIEDLNDRGIWVTTLFDETYPDHLAQNLDRKAPPFFYIAGEAEHLNSPAVGFVGSRDVDDADRDRTRRLVQKITSDGYNVVSGGAKGIDKTSEDEGLKRGAVVEFPTVGLHNCLQDNDVRQAVIDGTLTLVSHYHPQASWNIGAAMGRNKLIHGFGNYTIVVRSGDGEGGTWNGATENLKYGWSQLLVCSHESTPSGNKALIQKGATPIDPTDIPESLSFDEWVGSNSGDDEERSSVDGGSVSESESNAETQPKDTQSSLDQFD